MEIELYSVNDLQKLCRLCMGMGSEMYSVYDLTSLNEGGRHIQFVEMIMECSSLIVSTNTFFNAKKNIFKKLNFFRLNLVMDYLKLFVLIV